MTLPWLSIWLVAALAAPEVTRPESPPATTGLPAIARLEWDRGDPMELALQIAGGTVEERVAGVRALGRLRDPQGLDVLRRWRDDPEPAVRIAVAEAMGFTPRSEADLRAWRSELVAARPTSGAPRVPLGLLSGPRRGDDVLRAVVVATGRGGDARDVADLVGLLDSGWPISAAAAQALGTLATRGTTGLDATTPALVDALWDTDPRTQDDAAWALSRIKPALGEHAERVVARIRSGLSPQARAWLVRAAWPSLAPETREELFLWAMTDAPRLVQVAVLQAIGPEDTEPVVIAPFLSDADGWIRMATIDALARVGGEVAEEALARHAAEAADPDERARAVAVLDRSDPDAAADTSLPRVVRAAHLAALKDPELLTELASHEPDPVLRTTAAAALVELEDRPADTGARLSVSEDPLVRAVAVDLFPQDASGLAALIALLEKEEDHEVRSAAWAALDLRVPDVRAAGTSRAALAARIAEAPVQDFGPAAPHVEALAQRLGILDIAVRRTDVPEEIRVSVGDGGSAPIVLRASDLAEVRRVRGAVVRTDQGTFVMSLDPEAAPLAVASFAALAEAHWFDGLSFHRVVPGFVAQTGCPRGDGWGGPGYELPDEDSELPFDHGAVGMARSDRDTGGSQWFVTTSPQPHLQGDYTRFGEVVQGLTVVDHLRQGAVIEAVTIERLSP